MFEIDYRYLRPKKAAALRRWHEDPLEVRSELDIWQGENATILPLRRSDGLLFGKGGVVDAGGQYVELSCIPRRVQFPYPFENPEYRDEKVVYCGYLVNHWGHFLVEAVTRLWYFLENDPTIDKYVFFVNENEERDIQGNYKAFLTLLNVWDKIELVSKPTTYREVLVPERAFQCRTYYSPKFLEIFESIANNVVIDPSWAPLKKIYYSRSQFQKGSNFEFGLEVLDNFFEKNGYTILYPEKVPLAQMIFYIRNAEVVATLSGSLPHNLLFANNGQKLQILERCVLNNDFQVNINRMRQLHVTYIDANIPVYPVDMCGPFIMGYNDQVEQFAKDHELLPPDAQYCSKKHLHSCFMKYIRSYQDMYRYQWYMEDWYAPFADYLWEAYQAGAAYFGEYLNGSRPFMWHHYFEFHYWKQFIKHVLVKLKLYHP